MPIKKLHTIYIAILLIAFSRCASMLQLSGGQKDTTPPKIVSQTPENKTLNFSGTELKIDFDEFIQLRDLNSQLVITPRLLEQPEVTAVGKTLNLKFNEALKSNTTYSIYFGNAIVDLHEANPLSGLTVVFSTGKTLDSIILSGKIVDAFTLKSIEASVFLYENADDSCMFKRKPDYFVKADKEGNYKINFIKAGNYKAFAIDDKNKNFMYDQGEERIAVGHFNNSEKELKQNENIDFNIYMEAQSRFFLKRTVYLDYGQILFQFNKGKNSLSLGLSASCKENVAYRFSANNDSLIVFYKKQIADTVDILLKENEKVIDTIYLYRQSEEKFINDLKYNRVKPKITQVNTMKQTEELSIWFNQPVLFIDNSKVRIINGKDTIAIKDGFVLDKDNRQKITSTQKFTDPFKGFVLLLPGAVRGFAGFDNDSNLYVFEIKRKEDFGKIILNVIFPDESNYIVQLANSARLDETVTQLYFNSELRKSKQQEFIFERIVPGNYSIRIIRDSNKDLKWSTGEFLKNIEPEKVYYYTKSIKILPDWEINVDWKIE